MRALSARFTKRTIGSDGLSKANALLAQLLAACVTMSQWSVRLRQRQRGVSDHLGGRGRDHKPGQISWSLTPRLLSVSQRRAAWRLPSAQSRRPDYPLPNNL